MDDTFAWPSLELWSRLLVMAVRDGVELVERGGETYATSSDGSRVYKVSERGCACKAGEHGLWCKHRALYVAQNVERIAREYGLPAWLAVIQE